MHRLFGFVIYDNFSTTALSVQVEWLCAKTLVLRVNNPDNTFVTQAMQFDQNKLVTHLYQGCELLKNDTLW